MPKSQTLANAFAELEAITKEFEGELDLEQAIPKFKRAVELSKLLKTELKKVEAQIEQISLDLEKDDSTPAISDQKDIEF